MGAGGDLPLILGGLELGGNVGINVEISAEEVLLLDLNGELVVGEGPVGLGVVLVDAYLALSLSGGHFDSFLPLRLVGHSEGGALSKINTQRSPTTSGLGLAAKVKTQFFHGSTLSLK